MNKYTEDELSDLTPEERAALESSDDDNGEGDGSNDADKPADTAAPDAEGAKSDPNSDGATDDKPVDKPADEGVDKDTQQASRDDGKDPDAGAPEKTDAAPVRESAPVFVAEAPKDGEQKLTELRTQKSALADQFDEGDITAKEYQQKLDDLSREERELERKLDRVSLAADMESQRQRNAWADAQTDFMAEHPEYENDTRREMFSAVFRQVAKREEFADMPVTRANSMKLLKAAHTEFATATGGTTAPANDGGKQNDGKQPARKLDLPPTLATVPASDINDTNSGKWASLDSLREKDYEAYEDKLFAMSESDRDAYLAGR